MDEREYRILIHLNGDIMALYDSYKYFKAFKSKCRQSLVGIFNDPESKIFFQDPAHFPLTLLKICRLA
jgi:hypothetical protein